MLLSLSWLREFVPYEGTAQALADRLTMLGLELEEIVHPFAAIEPVVVGHVVSCEPHPDSDHMHVCKVDAGQGELLDIVCGAPNVAAGQKVAVALVGTTMPDGMVIKKARLRGEPSFGMICSERELGLSTDHSGILVLPGSAVPGTSLVDALGLERDVLDIDVTPNRADCLSVIGLAREVSVAFGLPLTIPERPLATSHLDVVHPTVEIVDPSQCPCYCGRVITGVHIGQSPASLRYRLHAVGVRAISNVVDVTNYILMECGQPLHSFDLSKIRGGKIIVAPAGENEHFFTLDGQERILTPRDITIRDAEGPVALGGVMGGLLSEITEQSDSVFLEAATFRSSTIRVTSRRLGLTSEASFRYERGIDQQSLRWCLDRASAMIADLAGGTVSDRVCACEPRPFVPVDIAFRPARCTALLGVDTGNDFAAKILGGLGCRIAMGGDVWHVTQPSWRPDLTREADLIEEVARYYGMDHIEPVLPVVEHGLDDVLQPESEYAFWLSIKHWGAGLGLNEAINYSFVGQKDLDALQVPAEGRIVIMNPLSADQDVLRVILLPGLLNTLRTNAAQGGAGLRIFELAHTFREDASSYTGVAEHGALGILLSGARYDTAWPQPAGELDYLDLKGIVENLCRFLHLEAPAVRRLEDAHPQFAPAVEVSVGGTVVGIMGQVRQEMADRADARHPVWAAQLDLDVLRTLRDASVVRFRPLDVYPPVRRDITVVVPAGMTAQAVSDAILSMKLPLLEGVAMVDLFAPDKASGERNLTYRLTFRHPQKTLRDAEVDKERDKVAAFLVKTLGVRV